jgi:hypothetical protein
MSTIWILLAICGFVYLLLNRNNQKALKKRKKRKKVAKETTILESLKNTAISEKVQSVEPRDAEREPSEKFSTEIMASDSQISFERQDGEIMSAEQDQQLQESDESDDQERKRPAILVIKPSARPKEKEMRFQSKRKENVVLTKKQRQNLRKREIEKSIKEENESLQKQRLEKYRKEQRKY